MPPNRKEEAEELRRGLMAGVATVAEAVAWADGVILADARPDYAVIEVSLAGSRWPREVEKLLGEHRGHADPVRVMRRVLGRMLRVLEADPARGSELARSLYWLAWNGELPVEHFGSEPYRLDDAYGLASIGYGTEADALRDLRAYLLRHAA